MRLSSLPPRFLALLALFAGVASPTLADSERTSIPLVIESGEITPEEFRAACELLGLNLRRFSFTVAHEHSIQYRASAFIGGKEQDFGHGSYQGLAPGKHVLSVISRESEGKLDLTVKCIAVEGTPSYALTSSRRCAPLSTKGYPCRGSSDFSDVSLEVGKEVPIWLLAAGDAVSTIGPGESIQDYAKRTDLVVVVYVTFLG